jgi:AbrB family looped-hinge helix DNA binding protein
MEIAIMNTVSKITSKGQVAIPCHIRSKFSFNNGNTIEFEGKENYVILRKPKNLMDYVGCLDGANLPDDLEELLTVPSNLRKSVHNSPSH